MVSTLHYDIVISDGTNDYRYTIRYGDAAPTPVAPPQLSADGWKAAFDATIADNFTMTFSEHAWSQWDDETFKGICKYVNGAIYCKYQEQERAEEEYFEYIELNDFSDLEVSWLAELFYELEYLDDFGYSLFTYSNATQSYYAVMDVDVPGMMVNVWLRDNRVSKITMTGTSEMSGGETYEFECVYEFHDYGTTQMHSTMQGTCSKCGEFVNALAYELKNINEAKNEAIRLFKLIDLQMQLSGTLNIECCNSFITQFSRVHDILIEYPQEFTEAGLHLDLLNDTWETFARKVNATQNATEIAKYWKEWATFYYDWNVDDWNINLQYDHSNELEKVYPPLTAKIYNSSMSGGPNGFVYTWEVEASGGNGARQYQVTVYNSDYSVAYRGEKQSSSTLQWTSGLYDLGSLRQNPKYVHVTIYDAIGSIEYRFVVDGGYGYELETTVYERPQPGKQYAMYLENKNLGKTLYANGEMTSYYYAISTQIHEGISIEVESAGNGYYLFAYINGEKTYLNIVKNGQYINATYDSVPRSVFNYDSVLQTFVTQVNGVSYFYGSMKQYSFWDIAPCEASKPDGYFIVHFAEIK
jgi:SHS2 domain-containing protein